MSTPDPGKRISIGDIENKLRDMASPVESGVEKAKSVVVAGAVAVGCALVVVAYLAGRRKGKKRSSIVEIRRI